MSEGDFKQNLLNSFLEGSEGKKEFKRYFKRRF